MITEFSDLKLHILVKNVIVCLIVPSTFLFLYYQNIILLGTLKVTLVIFFIIFVLGPIVFKLSWPFQRSVIFLNFLNFPRNVDYDSPEKYGVPGARNLYVKTDEDIELGTWQILPNNLLEQDGASHDAEYFEEVLGNGQPVVLYMHGNSGNRAVDHRIVLYQQLRKIFHVIAFDYGAYGDSTYREPTESRVVSDAKYMVEWLRNKTSAPIFVWGHSLGTGIACHALDLLSNDNGLEVNGLILECPFNNMYDEVAEHPFAMPFKDLPWFKYMVPDAMYENGLRFESDKHILRFNAPVIILHAEDDIVIPIHLGQRLATGASENRKAEQGEVKFYKFDGKFGYGHKWISKAPETMSYVDLFVRKYVTEQELTKVPKLV